MLASQAEPLHPGRSVPRGLITDWGGVLTIPVATAVAAWLEADGIDEPAYRAIMSRVGTGGLPRQWTREPDTRT